MTCIQCGECPRTLLLIRHTYALPVIEYMINNAKYPLHKKGGYWMTIQTIM